jgi:hypothetical protein
MDAPVKVREQLPRVVRFDPREIRKAVSEVEGFNAKLARVITRSVGTMACAYVFAVIALISLPAAGTFDGPFRQLVDQLVKLRLRHEGNSRTDQARHHERRVARR